MNYVDHSPQKSVVLHHINSHLEIVHHLQKEIKRASCMKIHKMLHPGLDVRINADTRFVKDKDDFEDDWFINYLQCLLFCDDKDSLD